MDPRADAGERARAFLAGLAGVMAWTLPVAYLLSPNRGSDAVRLVLYLLGAVAAFWLTRRVYRIIGR